VAVPKKYTSALSRIRTRAKKVLTIDDVHKVVEATYRAYEKARADVYPVDHKLLDKMDALGKEVRDLARKQLEIAEEDYRKHLQSEIRKSKLEERDRQRRHWTNQ
jgi:hypothetical protein